MNKIRKAIIEPNELSQLKTYVLNGFSQKVLIEGKNKNNPIVIFLHGGPGTPIPFSAGCRVYFRNLQKNLLWCTGINWGVALITII